MPDASSPISISSHNPVAYFCAEFGFDARLPLYAGGLGILAGDTLKQADDEHFPLVGVGLLYRGHRFRQQLTLEGWQEDVNFVFDPLDCGLEHVYVDDEPLFIKVHLTQVDVWLRCWKKIFPNGLTLHLLDADTEQNFLTERSLTQELYSGTQEAQLKQQLLLGIGGVKLLTTLGIHPSRYHIQEGRPAFLHWQLIRELMDNHAIDYESARKIALEKTVYTNHTLVAAGNQGYSAQLLAIYAEYYANKMHVSTDYLLAPGMQADNETFSMTRFALNVSKKCSGVSQPHTELSTQAWPEFSWVATTNGVHLPTWQDARFQNSDQKNDHQLWQDHLAAKREVAEFVRSVTGFTYNPESLVITWARRLAGYKQLPALFADLERLGSLLTDPEKPVQLLVAGKAHQGDTAGKEMLKQVIGYFSTELAGSALFIPDYSITVAQQLVRGSDLWLNTPERGREACGTSGMKAASNGVLQCSVLDGWTAEVDWTDKGWTLADANLSESLYTVLEQAIVPSFFERNHEGLPEAWLTRMRATIKLADYYHAGRMLKQYQTELYQ